MPFIGTDLGEEFDESLVLESAMVIVFEAGDLGGRLRRLPSLRRLPVTADGYRWLTDFGYLSFDPENTQW